MTAPSFLALHVPGQPLLLPNPWDAGSARLLAALGFQALATTSSGAAAARGRLDGDLGLDLALQHATDIAAATDLPVNADFENGFADDPADVAANVTAARTTGVAGLSIEDFVGTDDRIYDIDLAADRIAAAVEAAHAGADPIVLTARAENLIHGRDDLPDTIARLQRYQQAGADVLYAPGLKTIEDVRTVVEAVDRPVNVLVVPGLPGVAELAAAGVARISIGGAFAFTAYGAMVDAARAFQSGQTEWVARSRAGAADVQRLLG